MSFKKWMVRVGFLFVGLIVVGLSLISEQREVVWGANEANAGQNSASASAFVQLDDEEMLEGLPESSAVPGSVWYSFKAVKDWLWWRSADSEKETGRRLLHLANDRLRSGWHLCEKGEMGKGIETVVKAEKYLEAALRVLDEDDTEVKSSLALHYGLVRELEEQVPEEIRPQVTELLNVSRCF